jgi:hypothetical protein
MNYPSSIAVALKSNTYFVDGSRVRRIDRHLRVLVQAVSHCAWGLRLRGTIRRLVLASARVGPPPSGNEVGFPIYGFRSSIPLPRCLRFDGSIATASTRLEARRFATPFL